MSGNLVSQVEILLQEAASTAILPRYQRLADGEIIEKTPGELVTVADREAEAIITRGLLALRPGSRVVGEEACSADPRLLDGLDEGTVWLVDPLDGTANFAIGRPPFAVMTALLVNGKVIAAWMLDVLSGEMAIAERGSGAFLGGVRFQTEQRSPGVGGLRGSISTRFLPPELQESIANRSPAISQILPMRMCAGAEYPDIGRGRHHFALFWRTLPWDHAPGLLFLAEAGGKVARPDGSDYLPARKGVGLLVAQNPAVWEETRAVLLG